MPSRTIIPVTLLLFVSCASLTIRLGSDSLRSWDEAVYAECAKEMLQDGDWLTLHWNGEKFFQKPPFFVWCTALLYKLFGVSELTSRLISALAGMAAVLLTFFLTRLFFDRFPALISSFMLLTSPAFFIFSRSGMTDAMLTFFMLLALYAYLKASDDARYWYLVGSALGLATMTKGAAAVPAVLVIAGAAIFSRARNRQLWGGLLLFIIIASSWHIAMIWLHGTQFLQEYIGIQVLARTVRTVDAETYGPFYYLPMLGLSVILLPFGLWRARQKRDISPVVVLFALLIIAICIVMRTKHGWYILPALPAISTIIAPGNGSKIRPSTYCLLIGLNVIVLWVVIGASKVDTPAHENLVTLARQASHDSGPLGVYPDLDFGPEVLFYSNRKLCSEGNHTMAKMARCFPTHIIITKAELNALSTKYKLTPIAESGQFLYLRID